MLLQFCFSNGRESGVFCLNKLIQQSFYLKKETWAATWCWLEFRYIINTLMFPDSVTKTELRHLNWSVFWVSISFRKVWKCENFFPHKTSTCKWILPHVGHRVTCVEFTRVNGFSYQAPERSRIFFFWTVLPMIHIPWGHLSSNSNSSTSCGRRVSMRTFYCHCLCAGMLSSSLHHCSW